MKSSFWEQQCRRESFRSSFNQKNETRHCLWLFQNHRIKNFKLCLNLFVIVPRGVLCNSENECTKKNELTGLNRSQCDSKAPTRAYRGSLEIIGAHWSPNEPCKIFGALLGAQKKSSRFSDCTKANIFYRLLFYQDSTNISISRVLFPKLPFSFQRKS